MIPHDFAEKYRPKQPEIGPVERVIYRFSLVMIGAILGIQLWEFFR